MEQLRIPGPTPIPPDVSQAMARQMINHRGPEFGEIINRTTKNLKTFFQTENDLFILTGSGTGGLEAAAVNVMSPGDKVLSVSHGVFGERFAMIARTFGAEIIPLQYEWGTAPEPEEVKKALQSNDDIKTVLVTHNETSTGVTCDLESISKIVKEAGKLLVVDAISSLSSIDLPVDKWECDVVVTGSQKGWMIPPGLAMVSISEEAWKAHTSATMPRVYWDFTRAQSYLEKGQTPWTPAVSLVFALDAALKIMIDEGLQNIISRHSRVAEKARQGIKSLGLSLFADEKYASNTVTAVKATNGLDTKKLLKILREEYKIILGGGQQKLDGVIFRIGHLGWVDEGDIDKVINALKDALPKAGFKAV
ncbi:MAG: alanine--glyoxylate aminotransferase family protein [Dehalococcoidales bacterium]|nr:MAG: alanine--glyoxylate aminotransferase family protein [Dehalococcoidales bacterium]